MVCGSIRHRADQAAKRGAADGRGLRQAADAGRARAGLAVAVRRVRPPSGGRGLARPGAPRDRATTARALACKLQYPDMKSAVEADLASARLCCSRCTGASTPSIDTSEMTKEIGDRVREELDYHPRSQARRALSRDSRRGRGGARAARAAGTVDRRLLTMDWLDGDKLLGLQGRRRRRRATASRSAMFKAWWIPFSHFGVIHGDPHLGNYTVFETSGDAARDQPPRLWLHPDLPADIRRRRGRSLRGPAAR